MDAQGEIVRTANGRAEIDTRPPFRSVKDAVSLFGEGILSGNLNARKIKQTELETMTKELEKARQETEQMTTQMSCLKQELDSTKRELQQLKEFRESDSTVTFDLEEMDQRELKFLNDSPKTEEDGSELREEETTEFHKKRYVTFSHPTLSQIILPERNPTPSSLERNASTKKKNKKKNRALNLLSGIFPKRKTSCDV